MCQLVQMQNCKTTNCISKFCKGNFNNSSKKRNTLTVHRFADLIRHLPDVVQPERQKAVLFNEVVGAEPQQLEDDADVPVVLEPLQHLDAAAAKAGNVRIAAGWVMLQS